MVEVRPGLLLGSMDDMLAILGRHPVRITHLLSIINRPVDWSEIKTPQGSLLAKCLLAPDMPSSDLLQHFESCCEFVEDGVANGKVLVHCEYGISRSATMVLAYVMKAKKLTFKQALEQVQVKKPDIRPNAGFVEQLKLWEAMKWRINMNYKPFKAYTLRQQAKQMKESGYVASMCLSPDPQSEPGDCPTCYRCRKCRRVLFLHDSVLEHSIGSGYACRTPSKDHKSHYHLSMYEPRSPSVVMVEEGSHDRTDGGHEPKSPGIEAAVFEKSCSSVDVRDEKLESEQSLQFEVEQCASSSSAAIPFSVDMEGHVTSADLAKLRAEVAETVARGSIGSQESCCSSLFVLPLEWMAPLLVGHREGKVFCPKCAAKLGSFDWAGIQCSCGQWITPAFQIHKNRVDSTFARK